MSRFSLKMVFSLLVVVLLFAAGGIFFAATGLVTPVADALASTAAPLLTDTLAARQNSGRTAGSSAMAAATPEQAAAIAAGDALFRGNCAQCHALNDVVVGPALAEVHKRRPEPWLISWVKNSSKMVASGDEYALKIFNQYQKQQMPSFALSDEEIRQILTYLKSESQNSRASGAVAAN